MRYKEIILKIKTKDAEKASAIVSMLDIGGIYTEDYSDLLDCPLVKNFALVDEELLKKDKETALLHIYFAEHVNTEENLIFIKERFDAEQISFSVLENTVKEEDFQNNWKQYYKPLKIKNITVVPEWEDYKRASGETILRIDPGVAFGTGNHETTALCLEKLQEVLSPESLASQKNKILKNPEQTEIKDNDFSNKEVADITSDDGKETETEKNNSQKDSDRNPDASLSESLTDRLDHKDNIDIERKKTTRVLDLGCGSGILSIAALILGAERVDAVDIDPNAVKVATRNVSLNKFQGKFRAETGDILDRNRNFPSIILNEKYDIIIANIVADVLIKLCDFIGDYMTEKAYFILSGIITERREEVISALKKNGFKIIEDAEKRGWRCIVSQKTQREKQ